MNNPLTVDVRGPGEYKSAHINNAQSIPLAVINKSLDKLKKDQTYYIHC